MDEDAPIKWFAWLHMNNNTSLVVSRRRPIEYKKNTCSLVAESSRSRRHRSRDVVVVVVVPFFILLFLSLSPQFNIAFYSQHTYSKCLYLSYAVSFMPKYDRPNGFSAAPNSCTPEKKN